MSLNISKKMHIAYLSYKYLSSSLFLLLFPPFWLYSNISGKHRESISQRLGIYRHNLGKRITGSPRIWIHAVSVGEVSASVPIIQSLISLMPDCSIILSTTTQHGQEFAINRLSACKFNSRVTLIFAPFDFILSARKALSTLKPDILVCLETEIWPNWLVEANKTGIKTAIVNGRISVRSVNRYLKIRPLIKEILNYVDAFSMIHDADADRIRTIGASKDRIVINGNAKYDLLLNTTNQTLKAKYMALYNLNGDQPVFIAGSTRGSEEKIILDVYRRILQSFPKTVLILAPRHVERTRQIQALVKQYAFSCQLRSDLGEKNRLRTASVIIMDTMGELQAVYSIASIVFCGGSLVPLGGQNILEAAAWGKPVLYGPSMEDFLDAKNLLDKTGAGIQVKDGSELAEKALYYLENPEQANIIGQQGKSAVMSHRGAADKHALVIYRLLKGTFKKNSILSK